MSLNHGLAGLLAETQGRNKVLFCDLLSATFVHHHIGFVADINEIKIALFALRMGGVGDEFAIDTPHSNRTQRSRPWDVTDGQRDRGTQNTHDIRIVFTIRTEKECLNLNLIEPTFWKQRTDGAIGQATSENFFFTWASFALEIAAGDLARCRCFFAIINGQGEEFLAGPCFRSCDSRNKNDGFTHLNGHRAICLARHFSGFEDDFLTGNLNRSFV